MYVYIILYTIIYNFDGFSYSYILLLISAITYTYLSYCFCLYLQKHYDNAVYFEWRNAIKTFFCPINKSIRVLIIKEDCKDLKDSSSQQEFP